MATGLGIDVGAESIKVVQARVSGGKVTITGALKIPRNASQILDAPDEDGAALVPPDLGQELKRAGLRRTGALGISGREVVLKYLTTPPIPPQKLKMFIDMEIGGKFGSKGGAEQAPAVTYDYRLLNIPSGLRGDLVIMSALCKNEYLFGVNATCKAAGVDAEYITPSCFGLVNAYLSTQEVPENETVVLVDIGHELLEIAILEEKHLYFARSAAGGGKKFTAALDKVLKVGPEKARDFKHDRARLYPEGTQIPNKQELLFQSALKEGAENIASAIRSSVMFCRTQAKMPKLDYQRVYLSGGGARLNGLREYLEKKIGRPVQILDLSKHLDLRKLDAASARCFDGEVPDMAVALGLAVIDADPRSLHFALMPAKLVAKRTFLKKTVYGIAAGIVLLAGLIPQIRSSSAAAADARQLVSEFEGKQSEAKQEKKDFQAKYEENRTLRHSLDYYLVQTRMGQRYLDLFTSIRATTPPDFTLTYLGPPQEGGTHGLSMKELRDAPMTHFIVRGLYDAVKYPDTQFNAAWKTMRESLLKTPGLSKAELDTSGDADKAPKPGLKAFQLNITLEDPSKPVVAKPAAPAGGGAAPAASGTNSDNAVKPGTNTQ